MNHYYYSGARCSFQGRRCGHWMRSWGLCLSLTESETVCHKSGLQDSAILHPAICIGQRTPSSLFSIPHFVRFFRSDQLGKELEESGI